MFSEEHTNHIKKGYFQKGCEECAKFVGNYLMSGRRFKNGN